MQYSTQLLDYFYHTEHAGILDETEGVFIAESGSLALGDVIRLYLYIEQQQIITARFQAYGSVATIAAAEFICRALESKPVDCIEQFSVDEILLQLNLPKVKIHTAALVERLIKNIYRRQ